MRLKLSLGSIIAIFIGFALAGGSLASELLASAPNGIGSYQAILLILGGLFIMLGILPSDHLLSKLTLLCLSFVVTIMLIEGALLILSRANVNVTYPDTRELLEDDMLGKRTPPDADGHDKRGWRNETALDQADIVAIGDSQTWGVNVTLTEAYPSVLSELTGHSVYSMAQGSYGAVQYRVLSERAVVLSPQLVVIGLYFGNDFADAYSIVYGDYAHDALRDPAFDMTAITQTIAERAKALQPDNLATINQPLTQSNVADITLWERVQSGTYIGKFLTNVGVFDTFDTGESQQQLEINMQKVEIAPESLGYYRDGSVQTFFTPAYRQLVVDTASPIIQEGIRISKQEYADIHDLLTASDIKLLVVFIPTKESVYAPFVESLSDSYSRLVEQEAQIHDEMAEFFDDNTIAYVDALPALQRAVADGIQLYPPTFDGHPIGAGYHIIAEVVASTIGENDLMK